MPEFRWSEPSGRFRGPSGRFVASSTIRGWIDKTLDNHTRAVATLTEQFRDRTLTLGEWERAMRGELKAIHIYSGMAARGGRSQLTQADYGRIGQRLREQYQFLTRLADEIQTGRTQVDGRITSRARLFAQMGRATFHAVERQEMLARGWDLEENVLANAEHCSGCLAETARGRVPIGALVPIGQRPCLSNDRCRIRYSNSRTGAVAA
jgi:hypothetical protein